MHLALHGLAHQLVVRGMKFHVVDAAAIAIEGVEHRLVAVGLLTGLHQFVAGDPAEIGEVLLGPDPAVPLDRLLKRLVAQPGVERSHGEWLVLYLVGLKLGIGRHGSTSIGLVKENYTQHLYNVNWCNMFPVA
ncbi:hypothetical protein D3C76_1448400 [compost metagenome]